MIRYITPAVTPLNADGTIDGEGVRNLYKHLIAGGTDGILILGSIGEFFSLPMEQKKRLITLAVKQIDRRVPLIAGTADTVMENVVSLSDFALNEGADAVIIVPPYYFRLEERSLEEYYDALAARIHGKIYLYNFPDRTGYQIPVDLIRRLALRHPNIVGCKDTISGMDHTREIIKAVKPLRPDFEVYSGFDDNFAHNVMAGGNGCIVGLSNLAPEVCHAWTEAFARGDLAAVTDIQKKIDRLMDIYGVGSPFVPFIKRAMVLRGIGIQDWPTPPLPRAAAEDDQRLTDIMRRENLL